MCGFIGFFDEASYGDSPEENTQKREALAKEMGETIAHRGPDSDGVYTDETVTLGFRRLSIIDLEGGSQPMRTEDGRYVLVFNGEIYNYRELRKELIRDYGERFATDSDSEVLLRTYKHYGEDTANRLRGMFAFVIYDAKEKSLYGARDPFGIKPFYYTCSENAFLFGSEIKGLLPHPKFRKEVNPEALKYYLMFQYSPCEETIFKGVYKLMPGTWFTYRSREFMRKRYFEPDFAPEKHSDEEVIERIDRAVMSSVEYHQIADVEVGSFLSGGVDSSYVASTVRPMKTYSVGFRVEGFDETSQAAELCRVLGMPNKQREITAEDFFAALPAVQYHSDEPHANLSAVPLYYLAEMAAKDLKVVLSGEGADELFGGYDWYIQSRASAAYRKLPLSLRKTMAKAFGHFPQAHVRRFFTSNAQRVEDTYIGQAMIMDEAEADRLLRPAWHSDVTRSQLTRPIFNRAWGKDDLMKKMTLDMRLWLPGDILLKADKMTMAHSLELRVPYLDREVWEVAKTLTSDQKMRGRKTKRLFRLAARRHIPEVSAQRPKAGFKVPIRVWLREERYASLLREAFDRPYAGEFFDTDRLNHLLDEHIQGSANHARELYTVYAFLLWYEQYFILR